MRHTQLRKLLNRNAVTLALDYLADDCGVIQGATTKIVAVACRRSPDLTAALLRELEGEGVFTRLDWRDGVRGQVFVLMDSPAAHAVIEATRKANWRSGCSDPAKAKGT